MYDVRSTSLEFLDRPDCDPALSGESYRFMEMINFYFGGIRVVKQFMKAETARRNGAPLRILDIGSGSCDIPLSVLNWARKNCISLDYTCLETSACAIDAARVNIEREGNPPLRLLQEDAFTHQPAQPYDCAVASMCFHHFSDPQILTLIERLRGFVHNSVLINDLLRSELAALAVRLLLVNRSAGVGHDTLLSIQRGFKVKELYTLLRKLDNVTVSVKPAPWFRVAAVIRFKSGGANV
jgi:hypothetical protein